MLENITPFFVSLGVITLAEMADKTQLLSICFAARYSARKVMLGVFIGTVMNQGLAVAAGFFLRELFSSYASFIQIIASLSFIGFGIWTLKQGNDDEKCDTKNTYGPVFTVAIAFFIAEMGDKTQLASVSLAAGLSNPIPVLLGAVGGMMIANGIGVFFGTVINKKMSGNTIQMISAVIFIIFGFAGYISSVGKLLDLSMLILSTVLIMLITFLLSFTILKKGKLKN